MAKQISERKEAGVHLFTLEISEDELAVFAASLNYILEHCDDEMLDQVCGVYRDEVEGIYDDLTELLDVPNPEPLESQTT
jgi:hypothetical protein